MTSGIYKITSPSGKFYIGSACDVGARRRAHFHLLRKGRHFSKGLQRAVAKYGIESLRFEVLLICRREDLLLFEQRAIDVFKPQYNSRPKAESQLGFRHSKESRHRMAEVKIGKSYITEEVRARLSDRMRGNEHGAGRSPTKETRAKVSEALKGKKHRDGFESRVTEEERVALAYRYLGGEGIVALSKSCRADHRAIRRILETQGALQNGA